MMQCQQGQFDIVFDVKDVHLAFTSSSRAFCLPRMSHAQPQVCDAVCGCWAACWASQVVVHNK